MTKFRARVGRGGSHALRTRALHIRAPHTRSGSPHTGSALGLRTRAPHSGSARGLRTTRKSGHSRPIVRTYVSFAPPGPARCARCSRPSRELSSSWKAERARGGENAGRRVVRVMGGLTARLRETHQEEPWKRAVTRRDTRCSQHVGKNAHRARPQPPQMGPLGARTWTRSCSSGSYLTSPNACAAGSAGGILW